MKRWQSEARRNFKRLYQKRLWRARRAYMKLFGSTRLFDVHLKPLIRLKVFKQIGGSR